MKKILIAFMLIIGISSVTLSMMNNHTGDFDWRQLNLSTVQKQLIRRIEQGHAERLQHLREQKFAAKDKKQQREILRNQMIAEIKNVLTNDQQQRASEIVMAEMKSRMDKRLSFLLDELSLTKEQTARLKYLLSMRFSELGERLSISEIPDFNDRQQMINQLDDTLPRMLSTLQLEQWQNIKQKGMAYNERLSEKEDGAELRHG